MPNAHAQAPSSVIVTARRPDTSPSITSASVVSSRWAPVESRLFGSKILEMQLPDNSHGKLHRVRRLPNCLLSLLPDESPASRHTLRAGLASRSVLFPEGVGVLARCRRRRSSFRLLRSGRSRFLFWDAATRCCCDSLNRSSAVQSIPRCSKTLQNHVLLRLSLGQGPGGTLTWNWPGGRLRPSSPLSLVTGRGTAPPTDRLVLSASLSDQLSGEGAGRKSPPSGHPALGTPWSSARVNFSSLRQQLDRPTHTQKKGKEPQKQLTLRPPFETSACRSHSFCFLYFLSPHPSPFCHSPRTVRDRLSLAVTVGSPGSSNPATRPCAFRGTTNPGQRGSSKLPSQVPSPPGEGIPFRLTNLAR